MTLTTLVTPCARRRRIVWRYIAAKSLASMPEPARATTSFSGSWLRTRKNFFPYALARAANASIRLPVQQDPPAVDDDDALEHPHRSRPARAWMRPYASVTLSISSSIGGHPQIGGDDRRVAATRLRARRRGRLD